MNSSLLLRYTCLYTDYSHVSLEKVIFDGKVGGGLIATHDIPAGTYLLSACGLMSSDGIPSGAPLHSVITPIRGQLGSQEERICLGPFRFVNHDCSPNAQVCTHATCVVRYTLCLNPTVDRSHQEIARFHPCIPEAHCQRRASTGEIYPSRLPPWSR